MKVTKALGTMLTFETSPNGKLSDSKRAAIERVDHYPEASDFFSRMNFEQNQRKLRMSKVPLLTSSNLPRPFRV